MKIEGDDVIFSSGKKLYANLGRIGLGPDLNVVQGSDGGFVSGDEDLTPEERKELSKFMIKLWRAYGSRAV